MWGFLLTQGNSCSSMRGFLVTNGNYRHPMTLIRESIVTASISRVPRGRKQAVLVAKMQPAS